MRTRMLLVALVALAGMSSGCGRATTVDDDPVAARTTAPLSGRQVHVRLPTGALDVTVGPPVDSVSAGQALDGGDHRAPHGEHFVPVAWHFDPFAFSGTPYDVMSRHPRPASVVVVAGGRRTGLGSPYAVVSDSGGLSEAGPRLTYVPVAADVAAADVRLAVTYDGLTQVAAAGRPTVARPARALYHRLLLRRPRCRADDWSGPRADRLTCRFGTVAALPYLPGRGWARPGRAWWVVPFSAALDGVHAAGSTWRVGGVGVSARLAGSVPVATDLFSGGGVRVGRADRTVVVPGPAVRPGRLRVSLRAHLTARRADRATRTTVLVASFRIG